MPTQRLKLLLMATDRGNTWQGLGVTQQFTLPYCRSLVQKADDPDTLFVATGGAASSKGAVQRSRDGGQNWKMVALL